MTPQIAVFTGPTLPAAEAAQLLDARYLPPVSQGDVYSLGHTRPWAIAIIDGYFERVPAVWHKEILWAMDQGIHVFGAASMGALRAAELDQFGMIGIGEVFAAFRNGTLTDDDEVTVVHGSRESGYRKLSEAMVNIRKTLEAAHLQGILSAATRDTLTHLAKDLHYPQRSFPRLLELAASGPSLAAEVEALRRWLPAGQIDIKHRDAEELLRHLGELRQHRPGPKVVKFHFQHTSYWQQLCDQTELREISDTEGGMTQTPRATTDELRLRGAAYPRRRDRALFSALALAVAQVQDLSATSGAVEAALQRFRHDHDLNTQSDFDTWLDRQHLHREDLRDLLSDHIVEDQVRALLDGVFERYLRDQLHLDGDFADLAQRSRDKQEILAERGLETPSLSDTGLREEELFSWHFERLHEPIPDNLRSYARGLDFPDLPTFRRALLREYLYLRILRDEPARQEGQNHAVNTVPALDATDDHRRPQRPAPAAATPPPTDTL